MPRPRPTTTRTPAISARRSAAKCARSCSRSRRKPRPRYERLTKGLSFADLAKERELSEADTHCRARHQVRDHRSGGGRSRLRAEGRRGQRAGQRHVRHDHRAGRQDRAGRAEAVYGSRRRRSSASLPRTAPAAKSAACATRSRTSAPAARRWPRPRPSSASSRDRSKPSTVPAARRMARRSPPCRSSRTSSRRSSPATSASTAEPQQLPGGGYIWHDVTGITPARERTLDEVKDQVATRWRDDEIGKMPAGQGGRDARQAQRPAPRWRSSPRRTNLQVQTGADLQRRRPSGFVPAKLIEAAFNVPKDAAGIATGDQQTERYVFRVTEITDPKLDPASPDVQQLTTSLQNAYADDIISQYIARLEADYGVTHQPAGVEPGHRRRRRPVDAKKHNADRAVGSRFRRTLRPRRSAGRLDHAGRRSGNAGVGLPQARRRQADELPARVGRRRRGARPLFDHRAGAGSDLAHQRHARPRSTAPRAAKPDAFAPCPSRRSTRCAR